MKKKPSKIARLKKIKFKRVRSSIAFSNQLDKPIYLTFEKINEEGDMQLYTVSLPAYSQFNTGKLIPKVMMVRIG